MGYLRIMANESEYKVKNRILLQQFNIDINDDEIITG